MRNRDEFLNSGTWVRRREPRMRRLFVTMMASLIVGLGACGRDTTGPGALTPAQAYWALQLNQRAVMLALTPPFDTIYLHATPVNALGTALTVRGTVHYTTSDSAISVDSTGLVTAQFPTKAYYGARVVASLTDPEQQVTLVDTCYVIVTATAPASPLTTFSIQPAPGDSTKRAYKYHISPGQFQYALQVSATDQDGNDFPSLLTATKSSDATIADVDGMMKSGDADYVETAGGRTGSVTIYAQTWAYGVVKRDSLRFEVTRSLQEDIQLIAVTPTGATTPVLTFWPQTVTVGVGAVVTWTNFSFTDSIDVVFDDETHVDTAAYFYFGVGTGRGNIAPWAADSVGASGIDSVLLQAHIVAYGDETSGREGYRDGFAGSYRERSFPVVGTYHYHSTKYPGSRGTIVVK